MARATAGVRSAPVRAAADGPVPIGDVDASVAAPRPTGVGELDRVLGGGLVAGLGHAARRRAGHGQEHAAAAGARAHGRRRRPLPAGHRRGVVRAGAAAGRAARRARSRPARRGARRRCPHVLAHVDAVAARRCSRSTRSRPSSIPTSPARPGRSRRCATCAYRLVQQAKERGVATVLVGHVTKDGTLAGPRVLEHVVDTVLSFDGDRHHALRLLRALKHRFGATDELGLFEMTERGPGRRARRVGALPRRPPPGRARLGRSPRCSRARGRCWSRCRRSSCRRRRRCRAGRPRASTPAGWRCCSRCSSSTRASDLAGADVYASVAGGVRVAEPGADLARRARGRRRAARCGPSHADTVVIGELGLGGEVRSVPQLERRLAEAARLGFTRAIVPRAPPTSPASTSCEVGDGRPACVDAVGAGADRRGLSTVGAGEPRLSWSHSPAPEPTGEDPSCPPHRDRKPCCVALAAGRAGHAAARGPRPHPAGADGRADRRRRRPRGAQHLLGRLPARRRVHAAAAVRAGQDGRRDHPRRPTARGSPAPTCTSSPTPTSPPSETGTRHRTAERVGRQIDVPVITVSEEMRVVVGALPRREAHARADPARARPRRPGAADPRPLQGAPRRRERRAVGARGRGPRHRARRRHRAAARRDGAPHRRGDRGLRRRARRRRPARRCCSSRSSSAASRTTAGSSAKDYFQSSRATASSTT